jgi:HEAT repeat protein
MRTIMTVILAVFACGVAARAGDANELPAETYKRIRALLDSRNPEDHARLPVVAKENADALLQALEAKSSLHRELAAQALGCAKERRAVAPLAKSLTAEENDDARRAAAWALSQMPDAAAKDALLKALKDYEPLVRRYSVMALAELQDKTTARPIAALVDDEDWQNRLQVVMALEKLKDASTATDLEKLLKDENLFVQKAAAKALAAVRGRALPAPGTPDPGDESRETPLDTLDRLAREMTEVRKKLEDERLGSPTLDAQKSIEKDLETIIKAIQQQQQQQSSSQQKKEQHQREEERKQKQKQASKPKNNPSSPLEQSKPSQGKTDPYTNRPVDILDLGAMWSRLPPKDREDIREVMENDRIPPRFKLLLREYYREMAKVGRTGP